jgi:hypothetical protein
MDGSEVIPVNWIIGLEFRNAPKIILAEYYGP